MKEPKIKLCTICQAEFKQYKSTVKVCSIKCAIEYSKVKSNELKAKEWVKTKKIKKEALKTKKDYIRELQVVFNKFIRLRDKDEPCISCGKKLGTKYDAGHYRSAGGNPELRFEENNVNAQCVYCNQHLHGNLINYRLGIINRYGLAVVDWLESQHEPKHYSIEELKKLKEYYKEQIKKL
jgi:hypothetical protein